MPAACVNSWQSGCEWSIAYYWGMMDWLSRIDIALLLIMLVNAAVIVCDRFYRFHLARTQSRGFIRNADATMRGANFAEVVNLAARNKRSHVATLIRAGLTAFTFSPPHFTDPEAVEAARHAMQRSRRTLTADLRRGIGTLATIASSAPFIGLLGTCAGIMNAFRGYAMEKSMVLAMTASYLAEALVTTGLGLLAAIFALWFHNYFRSCVDLFESEMSNTALEVVTLLNARWEYRNGIEVSTTDYSGIYLTNADTSAVHSWEVSYDRQRALLLGLACCVFYVVFVFARGAYASYSWRHTQDPYAHSFGSVGGHESVSPDHRYRAVIPLLYRWKQSASNPDQQGWSCANPAVALRIVPNDRPLEWRAYRCGEELKYELEQTPALLTWNCTVPPVLTWRTNNELAVGCDECSTDNMQEVSVSSFPRITVFGPDGRPIHPQVVHPLPDCAD